MKILLAAVSLVALAAWADIPPRDTSGCQKGMAGAKCKTDEGKAGTCVKSTCSRSDYSEGPPPKTISVECLICSIGAADAGMKR